MKKFLTILILTLPHLFYSCNVTNEKNEEDDSDFVRENIEPDKRDPHTFSNFRDVRTTSLHLDLEVDFKKQIISGSVEHQIENLTDSDYIIFDIRELNIDKIVLDGDQKADFALGHDDELLGTALKVFITPETKSVKIHYSTNPGAWALQFLTPQQTKGKKHPYLFTQGEAILTRTWIPIQDTPANRITYTAKIKVPSDLMAIMSAENPVKKNESGVYEFKMEQPIPAYLIALAVGDIEFRSLSDRTGVYAEPEMIDAAAFEFADMEKMLTVTESLYGPYQWGRYDVVVLPPSFPFGGMENPRLTFATPTIITGDRSLVSLIAHEMAHSWSGNLVTNATWDDFWMNEGFTVYIESRIMEALYGTEYSDMLTMLSYQDLADEIETMMMDDMAEQTHLKLNLKGKNPDDGMTAIAYDKGMFFLKSMEKNIGREKFDEFLKGYFKEFAFKTVTSEDFLQYATDNLLKPYEIDFNMDAWVYGPGIPANCAKFSSDRFDEVDVKIEALASGTPPAKLNIPEDEWTTHEWIHFIRNLPESMTANDLVAINEAFDFNNSTNAEIQTQWYVLAIKKEYFEMEEQMKEFLVSVGRRKFLEPVYRQLSKTENGKQIALKIYSEARQNYHSISYLTIDELLGYTPKS